MQEGRRIAGWPRGGTVHIRPACWGGLGRRFVYEKVRFFIVRRAMGRYD